MKNIEIILNYRGADINIHICPEENFLGTLYPIEMNDHYSFTIFLNEDEEWTVMREADGTTPFVDGDLLKPLLKKLVYELQYAA
ncbi:MAG: hypothetical protein ABIW38_01260 [Ferruginibacter sp.]